MKRNYLGYSYLVPFMLWSDLATKTWEMMLASAQVVTHRTRRIATAGSMPNSRDWHEFALMGQEKVEATVASANSMARHIMTMDPFLGVRAMQQMLAGIAAMMSLAGSRTAGQAIKRQARLARTMVQTAGTGARISGSSAQLALRGLKPIHSRATGNAKRLGRR